MEKIILQTAIKFIGVMIKILLEDKRESGILSKIGIMQEKTQELLLEMLAKIIEQADAEFRGSKKYRKEKRLVVHQRNIVRVVLTEIGELKYKRTYYESKHNGGYICPIDEIVGIGAYERISGHVSSEVIQEAAESSYDKSSEIVTGGRISRQTVHNKVVHMKEVAIEAKAESNSPKELHIFADEDHVHMQSGKNEKVNLVTIAEGIRKVCKGRHELISPVHFNGYKMSPQDFWEGIYAFTNEKYNMDHIEKIYIHGDGANWIKTGKDYFIDAKLVLDEFHLRKRLRSLTSGNIGIKYSFNIRRSIINKDDGEFKYQITLMLEEISQQKNIGNEFVRQLLSRQENKIIDHGNYILNNWEAITNRGEEGLIGSCTEPMISHVLSKRLSRNPMGWSEKGLSKMSDLRVYVKNGGVVTHHDVDKTKAKMPKKNKVTGLYKEYAEKQLNEIMGKVDLNALEKEIYRTGKITGTTTILNSMGKLQRVV